MIRADLNYNHVELHETELGINKVVTYKDFARIISETTGYDQEAEFIIPQECYRLAFSGSKVSISTYHPGMRRDVGFKSKGLPALIYSIPAPNLILNFELEMTGDSYIVSKPIHLVTPLSLEELKLTYPQKPTGDLENIFIAPLPNLNSAGSMCYGKNMVPTAIGKNLRNLIHFFDVIWSSPFNSDYSIEGVPHVYRNAQSWLEYLATLDSFPYDILTKE